MLKLNLKDVVPPPSYERTTDTRQIFVRHDQFIAVGFDISVTY